MPDSVDGFVSNTYPKPAQPGIPKEAGHFYRAPPREKLSLKPTSALGKDN